MTSTNPASPWLVRWSMPARTWLLGAILCLAGLAGPSGLRGEYLPPDPNDELRKALKADPNLFPYFNEENRRDALKAAQNFRERTLRNILEQRITSLGDMARALLTPDWRFRSEGSREELDDTDLYLDLINKFRKGLEEVLKSNDPKRTIAAAGVIGEYAVEFRKNPVPGAVWARVNELAPELIDMTNHPDCLVRAAGVLALTQIRPKDLEEAAKFGQVYEKLLADPDVFVRLATARALKDQMDEIVKGVTSPSATLMPAERPLAPAPAPGGQPLRGGATNWPPYKDYPKYGSLILDRIGARSCTGLTDGDKYVRRATAVLVQRIAEGLNGQPKDVSLPQFPIGRTLNKEDLEIFERERRRIREENFEFWLPLYKAFRNLSPQLTCVILDHDLEIRMSARQAMFEIASSRQRARALLANLLRSPGRERLVGMGMVLGFVERFLQPPFQATAEQVALEKFQGEFDEPSDAVQALAAKGMMMPPPDIRSGPAAAAALEMMDDSAALVIPAMLKALTDWNRFVRWANTRMLGKLAPVEPEKVVPALIPILCDEDVDLVTAAGVALERYGVLARPAIPALIRVIGPGDSEARIAAMRALAATGSAGAAAVPELIPALTDRNKRVKIQAIRTLATFGPLTKEAAHALQGVLHNDTDIEVRREAAEALIKVLGD